LPTLSTVYEVSEEEILGKGYRMFELNIVCLVAGMIIGYVICEVWRECFWGVAKLKIRAIKERKNASFLRILEHYHHALILMIIGLLAPEPYDCLFHGVSFSLMLDEVSQDNPFAIGKDHFVPSTILGIILLVLLFIVCCYRIHFQGCLEC